MKFIYSLVDDNNHIFYIGCTSNTAKRYRMHLSVKNNTETGIYIKNLLERGVFPCIYIIDYLPDLEAIKKENELIITFI